MVDTPAIRGLAQQALERLLSDAEARGFEPPVPSEVVTALEDIIAHCGESAPEVVMTLLVRSVRVNFTAEHFIKEPPAALGFNNKFAWIRWWREITGASLVEADRDFAKRQQFGNIQTFLGFHPQGIED